MLKSVFWVLLFQVFFLSVSPAISHAQESSPDDEVILSYEPNLLDEGDNLTEQRAAVVKALSETEGPGYVVPLAPSTEELYQHTLGLSDHEFDTFIDKKQKYLSKISQGLRWMKMPVKIHNKFLKTINDQFYQANRAIVRANRTGIGLRLNLAFGMGLNSYVIHRLRSTRLGSWLPTSGGFFFSASFGFVLARAEENGHVRWVLEGFSDTGRLRSVKTFLVQFRAGADAILAVENRDGSVHVQELKVSSTPIGAFRTGGGHLSFSASVAMTFPPFVGKLMAWDFTEVRRYLFRTVLADQLLCASIF